MEEKHNPKVTSQKVAAAANPIRRLLALPAFSMQNGTAPIPDSMTGLNLSILAQNPEAPWREDFFYDHPYGHRGRIPRTIGVRTRTHSYTRYIDPTPPYEQLFDLEADPDQLSNLAENAEYAELLYQLRQRCDQLASEVGPVQ
jgi:arylsulfatase A-like enzyme